MIQLDHDPQFGMEGRNRTIVTRLVRGLHWRGLGLGDGLDDRFRSLAAQVRRNPLVPEVAMPGACPSTLCSP